MASTHFIRTKPPLVRTPPGRMAHVGRLTSLTWTPPIIVQMTAKGSIEPDCVSISLK